MGISSKHYSNRYVSVPNTKTTHLKLVKRTINEHRGSRAKISLVLEAITLYKNWINGGERATVFKETAYPGFNNSVCVLGEKNQLTRGL